MRTRSRTHVNIGYSSTGSYDLTGPSEVCVDGTSLLRNGHYTAQNYCYHIQCEEPGNWLWFYNPSDPYRFSDYQRVDSALPYTVLPLAYQRGTFFQLDFQKNNGFKLIEFLKELEESVHLVASTVIRRIIPTYGATKWGLFQILRDLKSLYNTAVDIHHGVQESYEQFVGKNYTHKVPVRFEYHNLNDLLIVRGVLIFHGRFTGDIFPDTILKSAQVFLDELGVHPDLYTIWELTPHSFVRDMMAPVGDFLQSLHPRGWFHPVFQFTGTRTAILYVTVNTGGNTQGTKGVYKIYERTTNMEISLPNRPPIIPEIKVPSIQNAIDRFYTNKSRTRGNSVRG